jgi:fructosamine-3-kinase
MPSTRKTLWARIESALGSRILEAAPMAVGFGLVGLAARLADGRHVAVKARVSAQASGLPQDGSLRSGLPRSDLPRSGLPRSGPGLEIEAFMLGELKRLSDLPVPGVHYADADLLVMDYIETDGSGITPSVERHAGALIAQLHATPRACFGYARDTLIGPLPQPNPYGSRWVPFFRDHRLLHMAARAHEDGALPSPLRARIDLLASRLDDHLIEPAYPSLLHGDLWTGNVLVREGRVTGFVDPAISFGAPEIELAFATLFGTFGAAFFAAYQEVLPLQPGFHEERRDLYNLYPLLVHVRLFGAGYLANVEATLRRFGV